MQKKNIFNKIQLTLWNQRGESYVDTGVKMLIAIVIGALLLTGIYAITRDVVLENVETQISEFFDQTPALDGSGAGGGNGGSGGDNEPLVLAATFADNSWDDIALACQRNEVPDTWNVGDVKTMTFGENEIEIMIIGKNHDEYADGGIAPLTFITKQVVEKRALNSINTNSGSWDATEMYAYLNTEAIEALEVKDNIKAVKKITYVGYWTNMDSSSMEVEISNDKLFLLSCIEVDSTQTGVYAKEGSTYEAFTDTNSRKLKDLSGAVYPWWLRSPNRNNSSFGFVDNGSLYYSTPFYTSGVVFGFCF